MRGERIVGAHGMGWAAEAGPGRWTIALAAASVAGVVLTVAGFAAGVVESSSGFSDNWLLTAWGFALLGCAAASVAAGSFAISRRHDHAMGVVVATGSGVLMTVLLFQQVAEGWPEPPAPAGARRARRSATRRHVRRPRRRHVC